MKRRTANISAARVKNLLAMVATFFVVVMAAGFLVVGMSLLRFPSTTETWPWLLAYPILSGSLMIVLASVILWLHVKPWSFALVGIFGTVAFRMILACIVGRDLHGRPLPRLNPTLLALEMLVITVLLYRLLDGKVHHRDYVAVMALYFGMAWSLSSPAFSNGTIAGPAFGILALITALGMRKFASNPRRVAPTFR
ncbi:MAG TPA: hypothetical protein VM009_04830 [Terriglobales bacterium]|nr:hypothetical protein [Terriglobales bacterium]